MYELIEILEEFLQDLLWVEVVIILAGILAISMLIGCAIAWIM